LPNAFSRVEALFPAQPLEGQHSFRISGITAQLKVPIIKAIRDVPFKRLSTKPSMLGHKMT